MAEKGTIVIPITIVAEGGGDFQSGQKSVESMPSNDIDRNQKQAEEKAKTNTNAAKALVSRIASQSASLAMQGYGDITGNYVQGSNLQLAVTETGKAVSAVALGWVGVAMYAVNKGVQAFNYTSELKKSEQQAKFSQKRVYGTTVKG